MGRWLVVTAVVALAAGMVVAGTDGQDGVATPDYEADIRLAFLGGGMPVAAPGQRLELYRVTYGPGSGIALHDHPGAQVMYVESGRFGWTFEAGTPPVVLRAGSGGAGGGEGETAVPSVELVLQAGDALFYDRDVRHTARVIGGEPVVLVIAVLLDRDRPATRFLAAAGTPSP